jgi:hypothetical protein
MSSYLATCAVFKDEPPREARAAMDRTWALIDLLGWTGDVAAPIDVDLHEHGDALLAGFDCALPHMAETLAELPDGDATKPGRLDEYQVMRELEAPARRAIESMAGVPAVGTLMVPPGLLTRLREGAYSLLGTAGEAVVLSAQACVQPEPETRPQLERVWRLLACVGWNDAAHSGDAIELRTAEHGPRCSRL